MKFSFLQQEFFVVFAFYQKGLSNVHGLALFVGKSKQKYGASTWVCDTKHAVMLYISALQHIHLCQNK